MNDKNSNSQEIEEFFNLIQTNNITNIEALLATITTQDQYQIYFNDSALSPSPCEVAIKFNHLQLLQLLVQFEIHFITTQHESNTEQLQSYYLTLLQHTTTNQNVEFFDYVASLLPTTELTTILTQNSPPFLILAIRNNNLPLIRHLIEHYNYNEFTNALHEAVLINSIPIIDYLMTSPGIQDSLEAIDDEYDTPLTLSAYKNKPQIFQHLITQYNANIHWVDQDGNTVAHSFAEHGDIIMIDYIANIDINLISQKSTTDGYTPLLNAACFNQLQLVQHLIEHYQLDYYEVDDDGDNILHYAARKGSVELINYIIHLPEIKPEVKHNNNIMNQQEEFIEYDQIQDNTTSIYISPTPNYILINQHDDEGATPIFFAVLNNNQDVFKLLSTMYNFNIFSIQTIYENLMHYAIESNDADMIKLVSEQFTTLNAVEQTHPVDTNDNEIHKQQLPQLSPSLHTLSGYPLQTGEISPHLTSPLITSIQCSKLIAFKQLIRLKANISIDSSPILPIIISNIFQTNDHSILEYVLSDEFVIDWNTTTHPTIPLIPSIPDTTTTTNNNNNNNSQAIIPPQTIYTMPDPIPSLINLSTQEPHSHSQSLVPLHLAAKFCDTYAMKLLIQRNADINVICQDRTILHQLFEAINYSEAKVLDFIQFLTPIVHNQHINSTSYQKTIFNQLDDLSHVLFIAAASQPLSIIRQLIQSKSDINRWSGCLDNILHVASSNRNNGIFQYLIQHHGNEIQQQFKEFNMNGYTPFLSFISHLQRRLLFDHLETDYQNEIMSCLNYDQTLLYQKTRAGQTIIHICTNGPTRKDNSEILVYLLERVIEDLQSKV